MSWVYIEKLSVKSFGCIKAATLSIRLSLY